MNTRLSAVVIAITLAGAVTASSLPTGLVRPSEAVRQDSVSPRAIALGDSIFRGKAAGGICFTCHQMNAKGLPGLAPDLTDNKWLHGDGSYAFIVATVNAGVPKPKQAAAPMLPRGGTPLTDAQVRAVAAWVYSLRSSRAKTGPP